MKKVTVAVLITFVLALWQMLEPTLNVIFGVGSKELLIISAVITALSFAYDYFFPKESLFKTISNKLDHVGTRPKNPPRP